MTRSCPSGYGWVCRWQCCAGPVNNSATFPFAHQARRSGAARLFGQATGGNQRGINGGCFFFVRLPASGIEFDLTALSPMC